MLICVKLLHEVNSDNLLGNNSKIYYVLQKKFMLTMPLIGLYKRKNKPNKLSINILSFSNKLPFYAINLWNFKHVTL